MHVPDAVSCEYLNWTHSDVDWDVMELNEIEMEMVINTLESNSHIN